MAINTLRPLRPRRAILLRKDAQLGLFGGETEVKPTAAAKRRERMLQPKPPKPSTKATAPKEGDTRINRAGNEEVLRAGRWRLASNPKVVAKDKGSAAIVPVVEAEKPMAEVDEDAIAPAVKEPMVEAKQSVSAEEAMMQRYAAPDVTYTADGPTQGFPGGYDESFARKTVRSLKTRLDLLRSSEAIAKRNAKYSPEAYAESYENHQRTKQAFLSSLTPLDDRLIDLLPPENTKRQVEIDKKIVEEWMDLNPVHVSADYVRVLAAMTPEEVIRRYMKSVPDQTSSDEFAKYAVRSGLYWTDSRTGGSFQLGSALTRELKLADRARRIFGISVAETPDDRGQINKPAAKPKSRRKPVEPAPTAVPAEVVDDAPKPTRLGDRIRAIANDLRDENDEQKKIAARILGAAAQMAQNYDNLVDEVVDMVGEDLGEDIRSLNPDATQADVEMVARDGGNEPPPTRLADKMKAIANNLRNETNEQVKATARILDAAAQIAQNYDNLVDEVAEMVGEDLEAGGGAIGPAAVDEPMVEAKDPREIISKDDVDIQQVEKAYQYTYRSPKKYAELVRKEYLDYMNGLIETVETQKPEAIEILLDQLPSIRQQYLSRLNTLLNAAEGTTSAFMAGGSNFNRSQAAKRGSAYDKTANAFDAWRNSKQQEIEDITGISADKERQKKEAREKRLKAIESQTKARKPKGGKQLNRSSAPVKITMEKWTKTPKDYKTTMVTATGEKVRMVMTGNGLEEVFITDKKEVDPALTKSLPPSPVFTLMGVPSSLTPTAPSCARLAPVGSSLWLTSARKLTTIHAGRATRQ